MYEKFIHQLQMYANIIRALSKGYLPISLLPQHNCIKPAVCNGGNEIILTNWPNNKHIECNINNYIPVKIPSFPYVLVNRSVLCNCKIEAENHFLLESLVACHIAESELLMYFMVNTAFVSYLDNLTNSLKFLLLLNWTMHEQSVSISLQSFDFYPALLKAPKTLKELCSPVLA